MFRRLGLILLLLSTCMASAEVPALSDAELEAELEESGVLKSEIPDRPETQTQNPEISEAARQDLEALEESAEPASPPEPAKPAPVATLFDVETNPGRGKLTLVTGEMTESLNFSQEGGLYALGLVFDTKVLPQPYRSEYGRNVVVQVVLGRLPSKTEAQIPQFGSLALLARYIPSVKTRFPIRTIRSRTKTKTYRRRALLMVTPSSSPTSRTDEDKLRTTFFGIAGGVTATPAGEKREVTLSAEGDRMVFRSQVMELDFDAAIGTPFNPVDASLRGKLELPIYWPKSPKAQALIDSIAERAMTGPDIQFALPKAPRKLSSQPKQKRRRRRR